MKRVGMSILAFRSSSELMDRLQRVRSRIPLAPTLSAVAREALRAGLARLEQVYANTDEVECAKPCPRSRAGK